MNITPEEAQAALDNIRQAATKSRTMQHFWAYYLLLWGILWMVGFLASQWQPRLINWIWIVVIVLGMVGSALLGITQGRQMRAAPGSQTALIGSRLGIFNGVLYSFAILWLIIFPLTSEQISMLWITVVMFSSIIAGVWLQEPVSIWLGIGITLMSVIGYFLLPSYFYLWVAIFAGLPLIVASLFFLRKR